MLALVRMAVETELRKRKKLEDVNTVDDVVNLIKKSNNIMILAGAGSFPSPINRLHPYSTVPLLEASAYCRNKYVLWDPGF